MRKEEKNQRQIQHILQKRRIMFFSVLAVAIIMTGLWGFTLRNQFLSFNWAGSSETNLFKAAKSDLQEASDIIEKPIREQAAAKEQVRSTLQNIIDNAVSSGTSELIASTTSATSTN
ncbi:MAG: hypothetical protein NTW66_01180 [Candidatus Magasanikbacteria bacterium]|nr:hypothetical protein [Candidatus Magasanikbacteria bacterium]